MHATQAINMLAIIIDGYKKLSEVPAIGDANAVYIDALNMAITALEVPTKPFKVGDRVKVKPDDIMQGKWTSIYTVPNYVALEGTIVQEETHISLIGSPDDYTQEAMKAQTDYTAYLVDFSASSGKQLHAARRLLHTADDFLKGPTGMWFVEDFLVHA